MTGQIAIPERAMIALCDMVDNCARIKPGMEVVIIAQRNGLCGGVDLVDEDAIAWTTSVVESRGANCTVIWFDEPNVTNRWRYPPVLKGAIANSDVVLNFSSTLTNEEIQEFRMHVREVKSWNIRIFALTSKLLQTDWALTPYELVSTIRKVSSKPFMVDNTPFVLTDPNGTYLEGYTLIPTPRPGIPGVAYGKPRHETGRYAPWPEWLHTQIRCRDINGVCTFNKMLGWWAIHIGIRPEWTDPVSVEIKDGVIKSITGGEEAEKIKSFMESMEDKVGEKIWLFDTFHFGVHPNAFVTEEECPHELHRRLIDHSNSHNIHFHLGSAPANDTYPFWVHITGDVQHATFKVGDTLVHDNGYLCALDDPEVMEVEAKYPDRPGVRRRKRSIE